MSKGKKNIVLSSIIIIIVVGYVFLDNLLGVLSSDHDVRNIRFFKQIYTASCLLVLILLYFFLYVENWLVILKKIYPQIFSFYNKKRKIIHLSVLTLVLIYIIASSLFLINRMDVSTDESTYVSTYRNYLENDRLVYSMQENNSAIPKDMIGQNLVLMLIKPFVKNAILTPRYITFFYSILLILMLCLFYYKNYGRKAVIIFLLLFASYPGFLYLSGSGFGENIAILYAIIGLGIWHSSGQYKSYRKVRYILGAAMIALSIMTKLQLGIFLLFSFVTIIFLKIIAHKNVGKELIFTGLYIMFFVVFYSVYLFSFSDNESVIRLIKQLYVSNLSLGIKGGSSLMDYFSAFNRFWGFNNIILFSAVVIYIIKNRTSNSYLTYLIVLIIFFNFLWYLNKSYCFRFMYFANFGFLILGTLGVYQVINESKKTKYFIYITLFFMFIINAGANIIFSLSGSSNEYQYYLNGELPLKQRIDTDRYKNQSRFYAAVNKIVQPTDIVYFVNFENEMAAFSDISYFTFKSDGTSQLKKGDYLVVPSLYYLGANTIVEKSQEILEIVIEIDNYKLYRVIK